MWVPALSPKSSAAASVRSSFHVPRMRGTGIIQQDSKSLLFSSLLPFFPPEKTLCDLIVSFSLQCSFSLFSLSSLVSSRLSNSIETDRLTVAYQYSNWCTSTSPSLPASSANHLDERGSSAEPIFFFFLSFFPFLVCILKKRTAAG